MLNAGHRDRSPHALSKSEHHLLARNAETFSMASNAARRPAGWGCRRRQMPFGFVVHADVG